MAGVNWPNSQDKFQNNMLYKHVFGRISSKFCVFQFMKFMAPWPLQIPEALKTLDLGSLYIRLQHAVIT